MDRLQSGERVRISARISVSMCLAVGLSLLGQPPASAHVGRKLDNGVVTVVTIKVSPDRHELGQLTKDGYDIAGINMENGTADIVVHEKLDGLSLKFQGYMVTSMQVMDTRLAPNSEYKTADEVAALLRQFATSHSDIARVESIGHTHEGRDIWAIKITDNPGERETDEPAILFNGMHHAREVMSVEVPLDTIEYLLTNYGKDARVNDWVDHNEIWVVPMLNPDGNNKVWNSNNMWRKNTFNSYGVDINRNYPYAWNTCNGSSGSTWSDTYRGPRAGSVPEVQALMNLVARIQPVFGISYHSYSEIVIYPYGCRGERTPTQEIVESLGRTMAGLIKRDSGNGSYSPGTAWELLYSVDGGDIDWMYNAYNVIPYVIELNSSSAGFQPSYSLRQPTVEKARPAWGMLLDRLSASGVRGLITDGSGRVNPGAIVTARSLTTFPIPLPMTDITWRVKADGTYHIVLLPGTYKLTFEANGRVVEREVTIGATRVDMDIEL